MKCWFSTHMDDVSMNPTNGIGPTPGRWELNPCSSVGGAAVVKPKSHGFNSQHGESVSLSLFLSNSNPCSSVGGAAVIKPEGHGFHCHTGQSFSLSFCGPKFISSTNAHMVYMG